MSTPKFCLGGFIIFGSLQLLLSPCGTAAMEPLDQWVNRGTTELKSVDDVAHGNGLFVSVGAQVLNSMDGINWWSTDSGLRLNKVSYGNEIFAGIEFGSKRIATSADGTNWVSRLLGSPVPVYGFGYGGGIFLLSGGAGTYWTSEDAINWVKRAALTNHNFGPVSYANGRYFLGGYSESFSFTSTDATSWQPIQPARILRSVAYGGETYVACANTGMLVSKNGVDWKDADYTGSALHDVIYVANHFVACGPTPSIWTSRDGTNWISRPLPQANGGATLTGLATDSRRIVAAGPNSTGYLLCSGTLGSPAAEPDFSIALYPGISINGTVGQVYRIEMTADLGMPSWTEVSRIKLSHSPYTWFDELAPGQERRFYRAVLE